MYKDDKMLTLVFHVHSIKFLVQPK